MSGSKKFLTFGVSTIKKLSYRCISKNCHKVSKNNIFVKSCKRNITLIARSIYSTSVLHKKKDYYEILKIQKNATSKDIKDAYYQLAKTCHPDTNLNNEDTIKQFQEVSEAYEVLSDETKRREYDTWGSTSEEMASMGRGQGDHPNFSQSWQFRSTIDPEKMFRKIFGESGFRTGGYDKFDESSFGFGAATEVRMKVTFSEAVQGVEKDINLNALDKCKKCQGSCCEPGTKPSNCTQCRGTGMETLSTGPFVMRITCRQCSGTRLYIKNPCTECAGKGRCMQRKKIKVNVPAGVEDGQTFRMVVGKKELFITFEVEQSDHFRRRGADVDSDATISLSQALLGGVIRIPGLYKEQTLQISPGTCSHTRIKLSGKGLKRMHSDGQGDHYVNLKITIPKELSDKQKNLVQEYAQLEQNTPGRINGISMVVKEPEQVISKNKMSTEPSKGSSNPDELRTP